MFGVGAQEMVLIGLLCLLVFGPGRFVAMARECGRIAREARTYWEDLRSELTHPEHDKPEEILDDEEPPMDEEGSESDPESMASENDGTERELR